MRQKAFLYILLILIIFNGLLFFQFNNGIILQKALTILLCAFITLKYGKPITKVYFKSIALFLIYIIYSFLSSIFYSGSLVITLATLQPFILCLFAYTAYIALNNKKIKGIDAFKVFIILNLAQLVVIAYKYYLYGLTSEGALVGTISSGAGQIGFLFPAISLPIGIYLMEKYNVKSRYIILLIISMFAFGVINRKRAIIYLLPLITLISLISFRGLNIKTAFTLITTVAFILLFLAITPNLYQSISGTSFDSNIISTISNYAISYLTMDYGGSLQADYSMSYDTGTQVGRLTLLFRLFEWMSAQDSTIQLFGLGAGAVTPSHLIHEYGSEDILFTTVGYRGAMSGLTLSFVETGYVGCAILTMFMINVFLKIINVLKQVRNRDTKKTVILCLIIYIICLFDYLLYSQVLFRLLPLPFVIFGIIAQIDLIKINGSRN